MSSVDLRNKILQEVSELLEDVLIQLDGFINELNTKKDIDINPIMQLSGIWKDIDADSLNFLTINLEGRRNNNRRLNHE